MMQRFSHILLLCVVCAHVPGTEAANDVDDEQVFVSGALSKGATSNVSNIMVYAEEALNMSAAESYRSLALTADSSFVPIARSLAETYDWSTVNDALEPILGYVGKLVAAAVKGEPVPDGAREALKATLKVIVPGAIAAAGGGPLALVGSVLVDFLILTEEPPTVKTVVENAINKQKLADLRVAFSRWKPKIDALDIATTEAKIDYLRSWHNQFEATLMADVFGAQCVQEADAKAAGLQVSQEIKDACWKWQKDGAPLLYGATLAAWHLDILAELAGSLDQANAAHHLVTFKRVAGYYIRYLKSAYTAYGVFEPNRAKWFRDLKWSWYYWVWEYVYHGRDCWYSDDRAACMAKEGDQKGHWPKCWGKCDVPTNVCKIPGRTRFLPLSELYVWYFYSSDNKGKSNLNNCWAGYKTSTLKGQQAMRQHLGQLEGLLQAQDQACSFSRNYPRVDQGIATYAQLKEYCGSVCASKLGLGIWDVCTLTDGELRGIGYGGTLTHTGSPAAAACTINIDCSSAAEAALGETCGGFNESTGKPFPECASGLICKRSSAAGIPGAGNTCVKATEDGHGSLRGR